MTEELIKNIRSIKMRLSIGVITTVNGTDHHLMNQLDRMEEIVNKNFVLADVIKSVCHHFGVKKETEDGNEWYCRDCGKRL